MGNFLIIPFVFLKMVDNAKGDFYPTYGLQHGCVIIKRGSKGVVNNELFGPGSLFDFAFVSPKNGKVYKTWQECQSGY